MQFKEKNKTFNKIKVTIIWAKNEFNKVYIHDIIYKSADCFYNKETKENIDILILNYFDKNKDKIW